MVPGAFRKLDGLRVRLVVLLLLAVLPAGVLGTYAARAAREDAVLHAQSEANSAVDGLGAYVNGSSPNPVRFSPRWPPHPSFGTAARTR